MSEMKHIPVDLGEHIVPLGKINRIGLLSEGTDEKYRAVIDTDDAELFTTLTPEGCCRNIWSAIRLFQGR